MSLRQRYAHNRQGEKTKEMERRRKADSALTKNGLEAEVVGFQYSVP